MKLYIHEMRVNRKNFLIWTVCIGGLCFGCILLYTSLKDSAVLVADTFSDMGAMSAALGMDKLSLATMRGYYATEIAMLHSLGGAMFAAVLGAGLLAKEEAGHTSEFLNTLPVSRGGIAFFKWLALLSLIMLLNLICAGLYAAGFWFLGESYDLKEMILFHALSGLMQLEIGTVCFLLSALVKRNPAGAGLGIAVLLFAADMMCRIVPAIGGLKYVTPFYYANAADIFTDGTIHTVPVWIGAGVTLAAFAAARCRYRRKDLAV